MNRIKIFSIILVLGLSVMGCDNGGSGADDNTVTISGAFALYPMVIRWSEEYKKENPDITFEITGGGAGKGMADVMAGMVDLAMISREIRESEAKQGLWWIAVAHDAVVATVNASNPVMDKLLKQGIGRDTLYKIFITEEITDWGKVAGDDGIKDKINVYTRADACGAADTWAKYLDKTQEDLKGIGVFGDPGLLEAVGQDINGIGYNNINYVYDIHTQKPHPGIVPVPLDVNGNGKIDPNEDFYSSLYDLTKAIKDGRYPSPPARDLYLVSMGKPEKKAVIDFLKWVLTDGKKFVAEAGYVEIPRQKSRENLKKLSKDLFDGKEKE